MTLTPETDKLDQSKNIYGASLTHYQKMVGHARKLECERDDAIVEATNAVNDIICVAYECVAWKANHDNQVELKKIIASRPDLAERAPMVEKLVKERDAWKAEAESLEEERDEARRVAEYWRNKTDIVGNFSWEIK